MSAQLALPPLEIRAFGRAEVRAGGVPVRWRSRSVRDLLFFLLAHPEGRPREVVLATLWHLEPSASSLARLRLVLHRLRAVLGGPQAVVLDLEREQLSLSRAVLESSDVFAFHTALGETRRAEAGPTRAAHYRRALGLYAEFMAGEQAEWVCEARQVYQQLYVQAAVGLALELCRAEPEGSCDQMAQALMQALRQDPYLGEDYHQWLMRCLAQSEGVYAAIEHYRRLIHFLQAHLGDRPLEETRDLAERIRGGEAVLCRPPEQRPHGIDCPLTLSGACQLWPEGGERDVS
ncbi:bacterial transcriptional activator domain-containing protein [uncultured Meiothermus sp.]|uniref:AfsR/SARP family transcriptional regulator n=1 Tax=uncultured Meiothermus sp. TaxID=157471 RepID=UPI0026299A55|nr:bacterial transcriptional activator domain-containing protein [uncultured Meiothermus sp.]